VAGLVYDTYLLLVNQNSAIKSLRDLVEVAKRSPKLVTVGGTGATSDDAVVTYIFQRETGVQLNLIPFRSGGEVMTALLGRQVTIAWANPGEAVGQIEGKLARPLAVAAEKRLKQLPEVPTFKELGINLVFRQLRGVVMPLDVPKDAVKILETALLKMARTKAWQQNYVDRNMLVPAPMGSEEFSKAIVATNEMYKRVFTELGVIK
jgi:putative tricarboxylic transport membrane protein